MFMELILIAGGGKDLSESFDSAQDERKVK
jgi:hypothetical protein